MDLTQREIPDAELLKIGMSKVEPYRHVNRAYGLFNMGLREKAQEEAIQALRIEPYNAQVHKLLGRIYNEQEEYNLAFESLRKAKLLEPSDMNVRFQLAVALYHLGEFKQAQEQCQRVISQDSKNVEGLYLLSRIYVKEHKYNEALSISRLLEEQGEQDKAKEVYEMVMDLI